MTIFSIFIKVSACTYYASPDRPACTPLLDGAQISALWTGAVRRRLYASVSKDTIWLGL